MFRFSLYDGNRLSADRCIAIGRFVDNILPEAEVSHSTGSPTVYGQAKREVHQQDLEAVMAL